MAFFTVSELVYRFANRDIILVSMDGGVMQPMYRSTGRNSGMPGVWLPFDGISYEGTWFDKTRYCVPEVPEEFHRFGSSELKELSQALRAVDIRMGTKEGWSKINGFLGFTPV